MIPHTLPPYYVGGLVWGIYCAYGVLRVISLNGVVAVTEKKQRISASIEAGLKQQLDNKDQINKSNLIETLLREYLAMGENTTVALKVRREELRREKQNKEIQKQTIESEIESIEEKIADLSEKIKERREAGLDGVEEIADRIGHGDGQIKPEYLTADNPIIKDKASQAGVPPERFVEEVEATLDSSDGGVPADD